MSDDMENRAVRLNRFGERDVLSVETIDIPQPKDDEVLVRVAAASANPVDFKIRQGKYPAVKEGDLPVTLGRDLAGVIEAVGTRAHYMLSKDDAVFAFIGQDRGAQARFVVVKAVELVAAPTTVDLVHAAGVPLAAITAWQGLFDHGGLQSGQKVLIHGGAGGVGHLAIQLAKAKGATVITTCGEDDLDFVRELGADTAIDYKNQRFEDVTGDVDMVFDLIAGETQDRSWSVLREGGIMVSTLQEPDKAKAAAHKARSAPRYTAQPNPAQLKEVADLIDAGKVKVVVSETYPLEEVATAHARLEDAHVRGKIVLTIA